MTTEHKSRLGQEIRRGDEAARLLDSPMLVEAFETMERAYIDAWASSPVRDAEGREAIYRHLQALRQVRGHLKTAVDTGKLARVELDQSGQDRS